MNEKMKKQYEYLKSRNREYINKTKWENNTLLQEFLSALNGHKTLLSMEEQEQILDDFNSILPRIISCNRKKSIQSIQEILPNWIDKSVYIIWDEEGLPIIQTNIQSLLHNLDDVVAVAFETWIMATDMKKFIQFNARNTIVEIDLD